ncbi:unnamed protein product [Rotaria socialis]|uniref:Endonuclease/exonuclease/phosphatase domain-containing protein n=2 Tax=Rotaria socialis TaxID=392032 RepID=A0A821S7D1_9BILA|nr:unnamed protein product [Rotaria socialis]CAF4853439.1 unnamed protein product [Rotaria socialis]
MNDFNTKPYRLGRRPGEQGPRPLPSDQDRVEKLTTGKKLYTNDTTQNTQKLKLAKNILTVGSWNVQTLWAAGKLELLRNEMKCFRYDIIGISEVRWTGKGKTPQGDFIWSGEETSHIGGVGLLLTSRIISPRFDAASFKISVIHLYAPRSSSSEEDIEAFYNDIEEALTKTDKKDIAILAGDWNAKIGNDNTNWKSVMGKYGYGDRNECRQRLLQFATLHNFSICNTRFQHKSNRKWTWASLDGMHKNMIDLILVQQRWKTSAIKCRTFQSADISSDHSLVLCNIKLRLKNLNSKPQQNCRIDVNRLRDEKIRQSCSATLTKNLKNIEPTCNLEEHAIKIEEAIKKTVEATIPATRTTKKPWISEETLKLADQKRKLKQMKNVSAEYAQQYKDFCRKAKKSARQDKEGAMLQTKDQIKQRWTQYCSGLYKDPGGGDRMVKEVDEIVPLQSEDPQDILYSEVQAAIQALKRNKSPGSDGITAEMLQAGEEQLVQQIHKLCNKAMAWRYDSRRMGQIYFGTNTKERRSQ